MLKNKKGVGGEIYLSPFMFIFWIIIGVGVAAGVILFLSGLGDIRHYEASTLAVRTLDCLSTNFNYSLLTSAGFNLYEQCALNPKAFENDNYYLSISVENTRRGSNQNPVQLAELGAKSYSADCAIQISRLLESPPKLPHKNLPQCSVRFVYVVDKETNENYIIRAAAASQQGVKK